MPTNTDTTTTKANRIPTVPVLKPVAEPLKPLKTLHKNQPNKVNRAVVAVEKEHQLVNAAYFCSALDLSWFGFHKLIKAGRLPAPIVLGPKCHRWALSTVEAVVAGKWRPEAGSAK